MMGDVSEAQKHPQFPYEIANRTCHFYLNQPLLLDRKHQKPAFNDATLPHALID